MRILIAGGTGMLGHKLWQILGERHDTYATVRRGLPTGTEKLFDASRAVPNVTAEYFDTVVRAVATVRPDVLVNCIGVVKQLPSAEDALTAISLNALFPHRLAQLCRAAGIRLVHVSTDCVFSGSRGGYVESDLPDAADLYGRTKLLGEVSGEGCLTLRTSIIGRELETSHGLLEWFFGQTGPRVRGYRRAVFSGFTTIALGRIILNVLEEQPDLSGVWHVASEPIDKLSLLALVKEMYTLPVEIEPDDDVVCDRSLNSERFRRATGLVAPPWPDMIEELRRDPTPYTEIRGHAHR